MSLEQLPADVIFFNGKILTVDEHFHIAEAVAIHGERFSAVGSNNAVLGTSSRETVLIDLEGHTVIPGIIDSHAHPTMAALSELDGEIPVIRSMNELLKWIDRESVRKAPGEWIVLPLFFISRIKGNSYPSLQELDSHAPDHPVFLNGTWSGMVNTKALELLGLLGEPGKAKTTGIIQPEVFPLLSIGEGYRPDTSQYAEALESMLHRYNSVGITGVTDGMVDRSEMMAYKKLKDEDRLSVRMNMCVTPKFDTKGANPEDIISDFVNGTEAIKIFLDGGFLTGTAAMKEPWGEISRAIFGFQEKEYHGTLYYTQEQVTRIAVALVKKGRKFTAHCVGDRALDVLLTAFETANEVREIGTLRWSVIHGNFFDAEAINRANRLGIVIECQIAWFYKDAPYVERVLGRKYLERFLPLRTMMESGLVLSGGSDHMAKFDSIFSINPYNPFLSIQAMVTRTVEEGQVIMADESISRDDALRCYTINGAYATGEESDKGSIEARKLADMVILDSDYLECDENAINKIQVLTTILGGRVVYERTAT